MVCTWILHLAAADIQGRFWKQLVQGRLIGFDQDEDAMQNALDDERFTL